MKTNFLKTFTFITMLFASMGMWGATQYCETASGHLGNADFGDRNACVKLTIVQSSEAGYVDVTLAMNRDLSATSKIDYIYVLYNGLPYTAGTDDNGDALDELTAHVNVGGAASGNLMIQYSNPNWGGRWQIELADVDFTATCTAGGNPTPGPGPEPEPTTIDWSTISWVGASGDKFKVAAADAANLPGVGTVQKPGWAAKDGIYLTFPAAGITCSHNCAVDGAGICLYIDQFVAKETEVTVNYAGGSKTFVVYYADGVEGSAAPESEYCFYEGNETKSGDKYVTMSWTTADNGDVVITLVPGTGATTASYRNGGFEGGIDAFVVSTDNFATTTPASNYFTFEKVYSGNEARLVKIADLPADAKIKHVGAGHALAWKLDGGDAWGFPDFVFTYGAKCEATKAVTGVTLDQTTASVPANKTLTLKATVAPADAANKNVIWTSSDEAIAKVVDGVVTPQAVGGPVTITARTEDGNFTATCAVTVTAARATEPAAAPEAPTYAADKVRALYSATYSTDCNHGAWGGSQSFTKEAYGIKIVLNPGNGYVGLVDFPARDCSTMEKFHADVWVEDNARMRFVPIITGQAERGVFKDLVGGQWNSIEIALNEGDWAQTTDWSNVFQLKIDNAPGLTFWINNVYFYTTQDEDVTKPVMTSASLESASYLSAIINVAATDDRGVTKYIVKNGAAEVGKFVPADGKITVTGLTDGTAYTLSIYAQDAAENVSDNKVDVELTTLAMPTAAPTPDVAAKEYRAVYAPSLTNMLAHDFTLKNWGSADGTKIDAKGYIFYHTTNNATVVWGENNAGATAIVAADAYKGDKGGLDASAMEYMHVDIWTDKAGCNSMVVVVNDHNLGAAQTLNAGWNSIDIPLSEFAAAPDNNYLLDNVAWIKFVGLNNTNDVAITNVYFWISTSTTKTVTATVNIAEAGTAVVKQEGVEVTEAENGSEVTFHAEANDGYVFQGWYAGAELKSTAADYVVTVEGNTTLQARFRALNNIYCHTELTSTAGDKVIYLTMKRTAENQYQVVIDSEEEMKEFSNAYIGGINGASQIKLNEPGPKAENVVLSDNKHRLTVNVTSTTPIKWNSPIYINMPGEFTFNQPWQQTIEYDVTCEPVAVETVTLSQTEATVDVEGTVTLAATASPIYADNQTVVWTSSNEAVATVVNGVVTGHVEGNTTITATIDGNSATCAITVALDPTVPHVAAPAVDATGKEIRAIYSDDVELAIAHDFGFNPWGGAPVSKAAVAGNNYLLIDATSANNMTIGVNNNDGNAIIAKAGMSDPDNADNKGVYAADMKYCHIDIWSKVAKTGVFVQLGDHQLAAIALTDEGWQSFDIELRGSDLNDAKNVRFMKVVGLPTATKIAVDNIYFWKGNAAVTGVSLNKTATTIDAGMNETLVATIAPAAAANQNVTWTSNAEAIATVDENGKVTAVAEGEATITVTTQDGNFTASCVVTVVAPTTKTWYGYAEKNDIGFEYALTYNLDKTVTIVITRYGNKIGIVAPSFSIDGDWHDCVMVGDVWTRTTTKTFEAGDTYDCFIQNNYSGGQSDPHFSYTVASENSKPVIEVTGVKVAQETLELAIDETYTLEASVLPLAAAVKTITWSTDNDAVATVDPATGLVTAIAAGTANIIATSVNGFSATCVVTVVAAIEPVTTWKQVNVGTDMKLLYSITRNADRTLTYTARTVGGTVTEHSVNDGTWHTMSVAADGEMSWTSTDTYEAGATVKGFFYFPARYDFTYTVGAESAAPFAEARENVEYDRMYTYCPAQDVHFMRGVEFYVPENFDGTYVNLVKVNELQAGYGYIMIPTADKAEVVFSGEAATEAVTVSVATHGMQGYLGAGQMDVVDAEGNVISDDALIVKNNHLYTAYNNYLTNGKAYIRLDIVRQLTADPANAAPRRRIGFEGQIVTGLDALQQGASATKIMLDGVLYIVRDGKIYNAAGLMVK